MHRPIPRTTAVVAGLFALVAGVTCSDSAIGPSKGLRAIVGLNPVFSKTAADAYRNLVSFDLLLDNIRIRLVRANDAVALDTTVAIPPGADSIVLHLSVELEGPSEEFEATIELRDGEVVLFTGTQTVTARAGVTTPAPPRVEMEYAGPGSTVTTLDVNPDTTISGQQDIQMRVVGRDANNQVVPNLVLNWTVNNTSIGSVTQAGVFHPIARGTATVTAELPTGVLGTATVTIAPPPTLLVVVSGGSQTGTVNTALGAPIVVEVQAADGGPVANHAVTFAVTGGGGSIQPTSATTGTNGRASATLTLGTTAGSNAVQVTATGLAPVNVTATGTAGPPTKLVMVQQPSGTAVSGDLLATQPSVQLQDAFSNNVSLANVAVTADLNPAGSFTVQGTTTRNTNASGVAAFTDLRIVGPGGITAVRFSGTSLANVTSQNITVGVPVIAWTNPAGGNWNTAANWSTGTVPTTTDDVAINLAGTYTVTLDANVNIKSLALGGTTGTQTLSGTGRTLGVTGAIVISPQGVLRLSASSSIAGSSTLINQGTIDLTSSSTFASMTLDNRGTLALHGNVLINGPLVTTAASIIQVAGDPTGGTAALTLPNGFTNNGLLELTSVTGGFSSAITATAGSITNAAGATLRSAVGAGGTRTLTVQLINQGTLDVDQPLSLGRADADHTNSGAIDLTNANLSVALAGTTPSFANTGTVTLGASHTMTVSGGALDLTGGTVTGDATAALVVGSASLTFTPPNVGVQLTLTNTTVVGGVITIADGQTLRLLSGAIAPNVIVQSGGTLQTHGAVLVNGALTVQTGALVQVQGNTTGGTSQLTITNAFTNAGRIELTSETGGFASAFAVTNGTLFNGSAGVIASMVGAGGTRTLAAQLNNQGMLDVDQPLTLQVPDADHVNSGTIDLTNANLNVNLNGTTPSFANSGSIFLGTNHQLTIGGGAVDFMAGTVSGGVSSLLAIANSTLAFTTATVTVPMTLTNTTIVGGSVTIPADQTLTLLNGGLTDPMTIQGGGLLLTHGSVQLSTVNIPTGGVLRVEGDPTGGTAALTIANGFTNSGFIDLTSVTGGFASSLLITSGALTNGPTALVRSSVGAGGTRTLSAQLVNQGTLDVDQPLTLSKIDVAHLNTGTIDLTQANLTLQLLGTGAPSFTNQGSITLGASHTWTVQGGTLDVSTGSVTGPGTSVLSMSGGIINFNASSMAVPLTLVNTAVAGGLVTVQDGQTLTLLSGGLTDPIHVEGGGVLVIHGTTALNAAVNVDASAVLSVEGDPTGGNAALTIADGFTNAGTIDLTSVIGGFASQLTVTNGTLTNGPGASIHAMVGAGGTRLLAAQIDNNGTIDVDQPLTVNKSGAQHVSSGLIDLTSADLTVVQTGASPNFVLNSPMTMGANHTWTISGGSIDIVEGGINGTPTSRLVVSDATFLFYPGNVNVPLTLTNTTVNGGAINVNDSQTVTLLNGGLNGAVDVNSGGTLVIHGTVNLGGLVQVFGGTLRVEGDNTGGNAHLIVNNGFVNNGTIDLTSVIGGFASQLTVSSGSLNNNGDASLLSTPGAGGARIIAAQLENNGDIVVSQPLTLNRLDAQHINNGSMILSANLSVVMTSGSFTSTANSSINLVGAGRTFSVSGGTLDLGQGSVSSIETTAKLDVNTVTLFSFTPNSVTIPMQIVNTTINGGLNVGTSQTVTLINSNLPAVNAINIGNGGTLLLKGGNTFNGFVTQNGILRIQGSTFGGGASLTVANSFANNGLIDLTSIDGGFGAQLSVSLLINSTTGTISSSPGLGGTRTLNAELTNEGSLDLHQPLTLNRAGAAHSNTGTFDLSSSLTVNGAASFTNTGAGTIFIATGQTFAVTAGTVTNENNGRFEGMGTLNMTGATFVNNAVVSPGGNGAGIMNFVGNYTQGPGGALLIQLAGLVAGTSYDQFIVSGDVTLAGTLLVQLVSFTPLLNNAFTVLAYNGNRSGTFTPNLPILGGLSWATNQGPPNVVLTVVP